MGAVKPGAGAEGGYDSQQLHCHQNCECLHSQVPSTEKLKKPRRAVDGVVRKYCPLKNARVREDTRAVCE